MCLHACSRSRACACVCVCVRVGVGVRVCGCGCGCVCFHFGMYVYAPAGYSQTTSWRHCRQEFSIIFRIFFTCKFEKQCNDSCLFVNYNIIIVCLCLSNANAKQGIACRSRPFPLEAIVGFLRGICWGFLKHLYNLFSVLWGGMGGNCECIQFGRWSKGTCPQKYVAHQMGLFHADNT